MSDRIDRPLDRRRFLKSALLVPTGWTVATWIAHVTGASALAAVLPDEPILAATPPCTDDDDITPSETAGPFYTPNSPLKKSFLEKGVPGTPIVLAGRVFSRSCKPVAGALLDFWHADGDGEYDNEGYRCRGHQFADADGKFRLETVVPGLYPGRTRHFHVRVQAPKGKILTTQLYFPKEPRNQRDGIFQPELLMNVADGRTHRLATFDFVLGA
jgi:protocatechuate 3,4-dioxygenase beta subunit